MKLILVAFIFGSVFAAGSALECFSCQKTEDGVNSCDGPKVMCDPDQQCATQIESNYMGNDLRTVRRRCLDLSESALCGQTLSVNTTKDFNLMIYTECCMSNGCNSNPITMPPKNTRKNGKKCEACFVRNGTKCEGTVTIDCYGNQMQCIDFTGEAARPGEPMIPYAFKGCTTFGTCEFKRSSLAGSRVSDDAVYTCMD